MQNNTQQTLVGQGSTEPKKKRRPRRRTPTAKANAKETQVFATISTLENQIAEWFEVAPDTMHVGFDERFRKRIKAILGE